RRETLPHPVSKLLRLGVYCHGTESLAVIKVQTTVSGTAEGARLFKYRIEYRCEVAGRGVDDLKNLGSRSLPSLRLLHSEPQRVLLLLQGFDPRLHRGDGSLPDFLRRSPRGSLRRGACRPLRSSRLGFLRTSSLGRLQSSRLGLLQRSTLSPPIGRC